MKFTPKRLSRNHNVSQTHPLAEFAWLISGLAVLAGVFFMLLGFATDLVVARVPHSVEDWLGQHALTRFKTSRNDYMQTLLDTLLDELPADSPLANQKFSVFITPDPAINAVALPGGHIIVFSGLLKNIQSENELVMVLGHELGHFAHRDHLRGLGRGLGITVAAVLLFGRDSATSEIVSNSLLSFQGKYSRDQESSADSYGLSVLTNHYGHAGGATDFFGRLAAKETGKNSYFLASHPHPLDRIERLEEEIDKSGFTYGTPSPLLERPETNQY